MGILVGRPDEQTLIIDDGSGSVVTRLLDRAHEDFSIGDVVNVRARPGEVNGERFLFAEIVKKLGNPAWLRFRQRELESRTDEPGKVVMEASKGGVTDEPVPEILEEAPAVAPAEATTAKPQRPEDRLSAIIRDLDEGSGADVGDVMKKAEEDGVDNAENLMQSLLEQGEIFVPRPGLVKTLE